MLDRQLYNNAIEELFKKLLNLKRSVNIQPWNAKLHYNVFYVSWNKQILDIATKGGLDCLKICSKNVVHKVAAVTGELIRNKLANIIVKLNPILNDNSRSVEEKVIPPRNIKQIKGSNIKWNTIIYLNY